MHTFSETGAGVPAFLAKLWRLVEDPETNNLICWSKDGRSFIIQNQAQFARDLLPLNYKHNNMASFIRQLNMYGFHKITSIENGGLKFDRDEMEFSHPCFKRNHPYLLEHIKRKIANTKTLEEKSTTKPEAVSKVINDVKSMRGRQDSLDSRFSVMKQENEALWREIASLRQKHTKQQQIVNKLIQFLITIVQPSRNMTSVKRHMQLMINDTPEKPIVRNESESDGGPVIHEVGEELLDEVDDSDVDLDDSSSQYYNLSSSHHINNSPKQFNAERPQSNLSALSQSYDYSNLSAEDALIGAASPQAIINAVDPDGSHIVYHVTEVPDSQPIDSKVTTVSAAETSKNINEENVLTTPMVREAMVRSQLKQKNKQRRKLAMATATSAHSAAKMQKSKPKPSKSEAISSTSVNPMKIKTESTDEIEIDELTFLNENFPTSETDRKEFKSNRYRNMQLNSPHSDDSCLSIENEIIDPTEMYNTSDFMDSDMPSDLFDEPRRIDDSNYTGKFDFESTNRQQELFQSSPTPSSSSARASSGITSSAGTFSADLACVAPSGSSSSTGTSSVSSKKQKSSQGKNIKNMTVAKYNNDDILREDVSGQIEGVQDDLETLKDLLRSDAYSLDANTLLSDGHSSNNRLYLSQALDGELLNKLFGDSDILGPYGLSLSGDNSQENKGSELMTYQPIYDLSDIIDINNKSELEDNENAPSSSRQLQPQSSCLNTPHHE